jgi:SAM-dependent methyltransferase
MFYEEAKKIGAVLEAYNEDELNPILEIGSSTSDFRKFVKPHIHEYIHSNIIDRNIKIIYSDLKEDSGNTNVEDQIIGDIFDEKVFQKMLSTKPKCILLCNILEHVKDVDAVCKKVLEILQPGSLIICTVPYSFPYHPDPIDNLFRPSPEDLIKTFTDVEVVHKEIIEGSNFREQLKKLNLSLAFLRVTKEILKIFIYLISFQIKKIKASRLLWLGRNYAVSLVVLKKIR